MPYDDCTAAKPTSSHRCHLAAAAIVLASISGLSSTAAVPPVGSPEPERGRHTVRLEAQYLEMWPQRPPPGLSRPWYSGWIGQLTDGFNPAYGVPSRPDAATKQSKHHIEAFIRLVDRPVAAKWIKTPPVSIPRLKTGADQLVYALKMRTLAGRANPSLGKSPNHPMWMDAALRSLRAVRRYHPDERTSGGYAQLALGLGTRNRLTGRGLSTQHLRRVVELYPEQREICLIAQYNLYWALRSRGHRQEANQELKALLRDYRDFEDWFTYQRALWLAGARR